MNYKGSVKDIAAELGSDLERGLTIEKAHERIHSRGRNLVRIPKKMNIFAEMGRQFFSLMNVILLLMAVFHMIFDSRSGWYLSAYFVICALLNAAVGYVSFRPDGAAQRALNTAQNESVKVVRSGIVKEINSSLLTRGDVYYLSAGQTVPADSEVIEASGAVVDESIISGDGGMTVKSAAGTDEGELSLYMGSRLISGDLKAIVTATGDETQLGSTMGLLSQREHRASSLARKNAAIGKSSGIAAALVWLMALGIRLAGGYGVDSAFKNSIAAAIATLPMTLPPLVLFTHNSNVLRLRRRGIESRSASAVETMGAATLLCVGKRGTLTQQGFGVGGIKPANGFDGDVLRLYAAMCTTADISDGQPVGDPMQTALIADAMAHGFTETDIREKMPVEIISDKHKENRLMTTVHKTENGHLMICKGAPETVAACCGRIFDGKIRAFDTTKDLAKIIEDSNSMSGEAMSVMAVAYKELVYAPDPADGPVEKDMIFAGLIGLSNAVRRDTPSAVKKLKAMGVRTCLITNENLTTAVAVAKQSGIPCDITDQGDVDCGDVSKLRRTSVFADISSHCKADIVAALNEKENVIVLGRGIRDISAMNNADVSAATDAGAKICCAAADINISGSGLGRVAEAARECKRAFLNAERMIGFLLSCCVAQAFCAVISLAMGYSVPFSASGIVWIELAVSAVAAIGIWCEPYHPWPVKMDELNTMKSGRISRSVLALSVFRGALVGLAAMAVYGLLSSRVDIYQRRAAVVLVLCVGFTLMGQCFRSKDFTVKWFLSNRTALVCLGINIFVCIISLCWSPLREFLEIDRLSGGAAALCVLAGILPALIAEACKGFVRRARERKGRRSKYGRK